MKFLRQVWLSCSGFRPYVELLPLSLRETLAYWALFTLGLAVAVLLNLGLWFREAMPAIEAAAAQLPAFSLTNGMAISSLPQPYLANTNQFPIILDLENRMPEPEKTFPSGLVIRKQNFSWWLEGAKPIQNSWTGWPDGEVNHAYLKNLERLTYTISPFFLIVFWFGFFAMGFVQAYFFTFTTSLLDRSETPFTFNEVFNLSLFSITPASIITLTYMILGVDLLPYGMLYFTTFTIYFIMSYGACRMQREPPDDNGDDED
jgi:hypothetical protein